MGKYSCIMFDLDGTLLDTVGDIHYNINLAMKHFGYPERTLDEARSFINDGAFMLIKRALPEGAKDDDNVKRVLECYLECYDKNLCVKTTAYDGICELIERLKNENYKLCVVSNKPERHVIMLCDKFFGKGTFSYISGTGGEKPVKPDPKCVEYALKCIGESREKLLFAGDSHVDVKTAQNAGVSCCGVTWGFHGKCGFRDSIPDFYADNANELYQIISSRKQGE